MLDKKLTIYRSLDLQKPAISQRSHLYSLEPIGLGTPYVESLTGYVARLAEAHCVPTAKLILTEIAPLVKEGSVFHSQREVISQIFGSVRQPLNGTGLMANTLVQALEALTLRSDLRYLTMLTWANVLSYQGLIRTVKAWCPICYEEWNLAEQVIYEPLIWALEIAKLCPLHHQPLQTQCSHCHNQLLLLHGCSRPGYCSKCGGWLGISSKVEAFAYDLLSEDELKWQHWVVNNAGDLLAIAPRLSSPLLRARIKEAISAYVNQVTKGNVSAFSYLCGIHNRTTVKLWHLGRTIPKLSTLLHVCYYLETSPLDFLTKEVVNANFDRLVALLQDRQQPQPQKPPKQFDRDRARTILQTALNECPPPTLTEVSRRLGVSSTWNLYKHFSNLCRAISSRYADYKKAKLLEEMRHSLEVALESDAYPPPSLREVLRPLKHNKQTLYKYFPDLCHAISARYLSYRRASRMERIEQIRQEVRQVALELHTQEVKLTCRNIGKRLTKPGIMMTKEAQAAFREVQRELGY